MRSVIATVQPRLVVSDVEAMLRAIESDPAARRGPKVCVGYCLGPRHALQVTSKLPHEVVAVAGHPGALVTDAADSPHKELVSLKAQVYFAFAERDQSATADTVDRVRAEVKRQGLRGTVERLPGVAHGFAMADHPAYKPKAAARHFEKTLDVWRAALTGSNASDAAVP